MADNQKNQRGGSSKQHAEAGRKGGEAHAENSGNQGSGKQGFASMDDDKQREIAAMGGRASHGGGRGGNDEGGTQGGSSEQHREAGRKGGQASGGGNR